MWIRVVNSLVSERSSRGMVRAAVGVHGWCESMDGGSPWMVGVHGW